MKRFSLCLLPLLLLLTLPGCGSGTSSPKNVGLFGNWNVVMYPTNNPNPAYVFGLAMSQEGNSTYSGASTTYTGSVAQPTDMCINPNSLRATATTNSNGTFVMTITDTATNTIITVNGSLATQTTTVSGTYDNPASQACKASQGNMSMTPQT